MLFLRLTHGRTEPGPGTDRTGEPTGSWGFDGGIIGPLDWVHTTYASDVRLGYIMKDPEYPGEKAGGMDVELSIIDGCLRYDGMLYGDWEVFCETTADPADLKNAEMPDGDKATRKGAWQIREEKRVAKIEQLRQKAHHWDLAGDTLEAAKCREKADKLEAKATKNG